MVISSPVFLLSKWVLFHHELEDFRVLVLVSMPNIDSRSNNDIATLSVGDNRIGNINLSQTCYQKQSLQIQGTQRGVVPVHFPFGRHTRLLFPLRR